MEGKGTKMEEEDSLELISLGREGRGIEFKKSMPWSSAEFKAKITKSILGMSNLQDGGVIIIGVEEKNLGEFLDEGMTDSDYSSYDQDTLDSHVSNYADPFVEFSLRKIERPDDGKKFVAILVKEFEEIPVICKKDGPIGSNLTNGKMYCRSRRKNETVEAPSQTEMREIIELAADKKLKKYLKMIPPLTEQEKITDSERFENQLEDLK